MSLASWAFNLRDLIQIYRCHGTERLLQREAMAAIPLNAGRTCPSFEDVDVDTPEHGRKSSLECSPLSPSLSALSSSSTLSPAASTGKTFTRLYVSHFLSTWNSRTFEFGAVLFLAKTFPGTLAYASAYALVRSLAAVALSSWVGSWVDRCDRLYSIRQSIVWQRIPVAASCGLFLFLSTLASADSTSSKTPIALPLAFAIIALLACPEKLASIANTVAIERDWVVVICQDNDARLQELNAVLRRIDLFCKLVAPVIISAVDAYSTIVAIWTVLGQNLLSAAVEYYAIAQVYDVTPALQRESASIPLKVIDDDCAAGANGATTSKSSVHDATKRRRPLRDLAEVAHKQVGQIVAPITEYIGSPVFLPSFALSMLYCTVLSMHVPLMAYMFAVGMPAYLVSLLRVLGVGVELSATFFAPRMMNKIGTVRSGLWFINWQLGCLLIGATVFYAAGAGANLGPAGDGSSGGAASQPIKTLTYYLAPAGLIGGTILSRFGLWGFDLCAQFLIQEETPASIRARFSSTEAALQNLFELLSFVSTIVFARPNQFRYPAGMSCIAVALSCVCFTAYVKQRIGHLAHPFRCWTARNRRVSVYRSVPQEEMTVV